MRTSFALPSSALNEFAAKMNACSWLVVGAKSNEVRVIWPGLEGAAIGVLLHFLDGLCLVLAAKERVFVACLDVAGVGAESNGASVALCLSHPARRNVELAGARLTT